MENPGSGRAQVLPVGTLTEICRVHALLPDEGRIGVTAIDKRPVAEPVTVHSLGLRADLQADRKNHSGADKALYAYSQSDADFWAAELGYPVPAGLFGENLRVAGIEASAALIGERWQVGEQALLEVTMPRTPCATFQRRLDEPQWVGRFLRAGRIGCYLRVLRPGQIEPGDRVEIVHRPGHDVSVAAWLLAADAQMASALDAEPELALAPGIRQGVDQLLASR